MKNLLLLLSLGLLVISGCGSKDMAPEIEAKLIDGTAFKLSDLKGSYVVLDFWGSWCGPCLSDMPKLKALHDKYGDRVEFVSVAFEKNDRYWKGVAEKNGMIWKYQIVENTAVLLGSSIARDYGVTDIPAKFIITPEGKLVSGMDFQQMDTFLEASLPPRVH